MPVPQFKGFIEPLLRVLAQCSEGVSTADAHERVAKALGLTDADKQELLAAGQPVYKNRNGWAQDRLKRAGLSISSSRGVWQLTPAGVAFVRDHATPLSAEEIERIASVEDERQGVLWRDRLATCRADTEWMAQRADAAKSRTAILPGMRALIRAFLGHEASLEDLRATFDQKTRPGGEWGAFGFGAMSGAMVLNQLLKNADRAKVEEQIRALLPEPTNELAAAGSLRRFASFLESERSRVGPDVNIPVPSRAGFFASAFWHIQNPEEWPAYYTSARNALASDGLYERKPDAGDDYLAFRSAFGKLRDALGIGTWELESLLRWVRRGPQENDVPGEEEEDTSGARVWLIALGSNADQWEASYKQGVIGIGWQTGDLRGFPTPEAIRAKIRSDRGDDTEPMNAGLACWQFAHEMRPGDIVYVKRGRRFIVGYGVVKSEYRYDADSKLWPHQRDVEWRAKGEWRPREKSLTVKTLTEIGKYPGLLSDIRKALRGGDAPESEPELGAPDSPKPAPPGYSLDDAEADLFLSREQTTELVELLRYKKNLILQGPPGVGKTFVARRLAYLLLRAKAPEQLCVVQFHPSYSYEDFVQGLRPVEEGGFARKDGPFLRFCKDALEDQASPYVLIIDEINRGNVSKIFGELLSLIEADKRRPADAVTLAYSVEDEPEFHVPPNLHIIGTMNTADRSLALVDYALRRRFGFADLAPAFHTDRFEAELTRMGVDGGLRKRIRERMTALNELITNDSSLGAGFRLGHSYFCQRADLHDETWLERIIEYEVAPLLREYWFDSPSRVDEALAALRAEA